MITDATIMIDRGKGFRLLPRMDDCMRASRVRDSARYLADNDWLEIGKLDGRTSIGLGLHARKLLEEATGPVT